MYKFRPYFGKILKFHLFFLSLPFFGLVYVCLLFPILTLMHLCIMLYMYWMPLNVPNYSHRPHNFSVVTEVLHLQTESVSETLRRVWEGRKIFSPTKMTFFSEKISILVANISDDLFLVIDQVFRIFPLLPDFPDLFFVRYRTQPFPHKKNTFFYSFHTFAHIRQLYFSKYWGGRMHEPSPHLKLWGDCPLSPP